MTNLALFGLCVTAAIVLDRRLKPRQWRKWLGIAMAALGVVATFSFPLELYEIDFGYVYLIAWLGGLSMFIDRDRFEDDE